jgi:hypothetical protein
MTAHFLPRQNKTEWTAWRHSVATLVAKLNDPELIAIVLFCLIALLVTTGDLRWDLQRHTQAAFQTTPLCFVHTCFVF